MLAVVISAAIRWTALTGSDFPLNDGGLFHVMARDLQASAWALPAYTSYNNLAIPFAYPPLGLYLAALLDSATGWTLLDALRLLPLLWSILCFVVFSLLARDVLVSRDEQVAALLAFALLPASFLWYLMGGGVTRGLGFLFAILALQQTYRLYTRGRRWHLPLAILLAAATALSHPQQAWFLAYSIAIMAVFKGRSRQGLANTALLAAGMLVLSAPWWLTVVARHGLAPFVASTQHGWPWFNGLLQLLISGGTQEPFVPLIALLALLGAVACARRRDWWLPIWLLAVFLLDSWLPATVASVPMALLAGVGVIQVVIPLLQQGAAALGGSLAAPPSARLARWLVPLVLALLFVYTAFAALVAANAFLADLSDDEQAAMAWAADNTPDDSRFLVVTADRWGEDRSAEWFPALAQRPSVATVQGTEWLPSGEFARRVHASAALQACASADSTCLEAWIAEHGADVSHVYVPKRPSAAGQFERPASVARPPDCCGALRFSLAQDSRYRLLYDGPGAAIYARHAAATGRR